MSATQCFHYRASAWAFAVDRPFEDGPVLIKDCFALQGYCAWTIVKHDRVLIPGNPDIGILQYKDRYFAFSSKEAAEYFVKDPDK